MCCTAHVLPSIYFLVFFIRVSVFLHSIFYVLMRFLRFFYDLFSQIFTFLCWSRIFIFHHPLITLPSHRPTQSFSRMKYLQDVSNQFTGEIFCIAVIYYNPFENPQFKSHIPAKSRLQPRKLYVSQILLALREYINIFTFQYISNFSKYYKLLRRKWIQNLISFPKKSKISQVLKSFHKNLYIRKRLNFSQQILYFPNITNFCESKIVFSKCC